MAADELSRSGRAEEPPTIRAVLFDLDGVVRHFPPCDTMEREHGLPLGTLSELPFEGDLINPTVTGIWSYDDWIAAIGDRLAERYGPSARAAAQAFASFVATVDRDVVDVAVRLRPAYTTAIVTNGTTRVEEELRALGVDADFDHVFNSARIGYAKPDVRIFRFVLDTIGCAANECVFIDDSETKLAGAVAVGMRAVHFTGIEPLKSQLRSFGVELALGRAHTDRGDRCRACGWPASPPLPRAAACSARRARSLPASRGVRATAIVMSGP
jgi:putative hydrolase of the HAD superfamily